LTLASDIGSTTGNKIFWVNVLYSFADLGIEMSKEFWIEIFEFKTRSVELKNVFSSQILDFSPEFVTDELV
jgi:hypothetical protein